jgi:hypothetical protein
MEIATAVAGILAPLSISLVLAAVFAGLFLGAFYNYLLEVPEWVVFHKLVAGWAFIAFMFMFRLAEGAATSFFGWIGIGLLWGLFCLFIWLGNRLVRKITGKARL